MGNTDWLAVTVGILFAMMGLGMAAGITGSVVAAHHEHRCLAAGYKASKTTLYLDFYCIRLIEKQP